MRFRIEDEEKPGQGSDDPGRHGEVASLASKRTGHRFDEARSNQKGADHFGVDRLSGRQQCGTRAQEDDEQTRNAQSLCPSAVG